MNDNQLYQTKEYCESGMFYDIPEPSLEDLFDDYCARFPRTDAVGHINYLLSDANATDNCIYEVRRRVSKPVRFEDAAAVAERLLTARENFNLDSSEPVTRFTL